MSFLSRRLPWLAMLTIYIVWGSTYLAIRIVVRELPPLGTAGLRFTMAGLVLAMTAVLFERRAGLPSPRQLGDYSLVGCLLFAGNGLVMWAEQRIPSGIAALLVSTVPLWLTFIEGLRPGGRPWTTRAWLGTLAGLAGVAIVVRPTTGGAALSLPRAAALVLASLLWSIGSLHAQSVRRRLPVASAAAVEMLAGAAMLWLGSFALGERQALFLSASRSAWLAVAYLTMIGSLVGFTAFAYALHKLPAVTVGTYAFVNPVVAVALGALVLREQVSPLLGVGAALIVSGVVLLTLRPKQIRALHVTRPATPERARDAERGQAAPDE